MSIKITYFVHGTTTDNEKGVATGWLSGELSETGIKQSKDLTGQVKDKYFDVVFCSDLKRAVDSAHLSFDDRGVNIIEDSRLRECNYGDFNGTADSFKGSLDKNIDSPFPNGESYKDVEKRIKSFLDFLKQRYHDKQVAIVAHQAPQLALDVLLKNKTWLQAVAEDWRHTKSWQPGWEYVLN